MQTSLFIDTSGAGLHDVTDALHAALAALGAGDGLLTLFIRHTSASLLIQENADPDVRADLQGFFERLVPDGDDPSMSWLRHTCEGPDDMPAHIKAALLPVSLSIPLVRGRPVLGRWQGVYLVEHRRAPHRREVVIRVT